jgi:hypothetical protein
MTIYVVQAAALDEASLAKARFVPQRFAKAAFIFGPLWLLYHQLWAASFAWIVAEAALLALVSPHVGAGGLIVLDLIARLYLGLEGGALRVRRSAVLDLVEARDQDEAESIFFRRRFGVAASQPDAA